MLRPVLTGPRSQFRAICIQCCMLRDGAHNANGIRYYRGTHSIHCGIRECIVTCSQSPTSPKMVKAACHPSGSPFERHSSIERIGRWFRACLQRRHMPKGRTVANDMTNTTDNNAVPSAKACEARGKLRMLPGN